ncbi:GNAT family N-acetyltransferase [Globicatella sanguinis]|nr:GNAT family N-acetyltransferase [Globicatella sanguinis]MDK7631143.1 GNAT family N-acetyltransferase [Globicatella sanguinis]WIK67604.1 GNAT family N-acetyltransferase [Globicatella sanguinis]WKT57009.1 GNAT family N-acetyltransferase [Globicatella sanguinis]
MIRVVGDGYSILFIQDILVLPEFQRQGIGSTLLKKVINTFSNVYQMHLLTDDMEKTRKFHESVGFKDVKDLQGAAFTL